MNRNAARVMVVAFFSLMIFVSACSVISKNVRQQADPSVAFDALRTNPAGYLGRTILLGGYILEVQNLPDKTRISVLQTPLGSQDRPEGRERSEGRFVIVADGLMDPAVYKAELGITVAGTVIGQEVVQIDQVSYPTVAIKPIEMHLWRREPSPYLRGPYYDPFYYNPDFYSPWYYDPFYPWPGPHYLYRPLPPPRRSSEPRR